MGSVRYAVWPVPAPPVCTAAWDQAAWQRYEDRYRPAWYDGPPFDQEAFDRAKETR
jgi:hypothetical protein